MSYFLPFTHKASPKQSHDVWLFPVVGPSDLLNLIGFEERLAENYDKIEAHTPQRGNALHENSAYGAFLRKER